MKASELMEIRRNWFDKYHPYKMVHWDKFDFNILQNIMWLKRGGRGSNKSYNDVIIMADTETSKKKKPEIYQNHVVAWTISIRAFNRNIVTIWGHKPTTMIECIEMILEAMEGDITYIFFHNLAYDWVFIRKFFFKKFGEPCGQLNTKSHYPIQIVFNNNLILRDSLILAQRSLEKWAKDLDVEHKKAVGKWDYDKLRTQKEDYDQDELEYIEHDTLAGVECIQKTMDALNKRIYSLPYTATGIPREETRKRGKEHGAHEKYLQMAPTYEQQEKLEKCYHGGYTHGNRHFLSTTMGPDEEELIYPKDFASSYPFVLLSEKMPTERFTDIHDMKWEEMKPMCEEYAFIFKAILIEPSLQDDFIPMPALQFSKCTKIINPILDNGRVLACSYAEIYLTEIDAEVIFSQYKMKKHILTEVEFAHKNYLPRWLTDYVYELFQQKTTLKGGDPVLYALAKARLNSVYGLMVQKPVKEILEEDYLTGSFEAQEEDMEEKYYKYVNRYTSILPYQWGVYVTSYAFRNLFQLGSCVAADGIWLYSDTDSCYAMKWDEEKVQAYNQICKDKLLKNGYGPVLFNDREYWLGIAESDSPYTEYRYLGAKRYCGRSSEDKELHITVAGVPKKGSICLDDDIEKFKKGFIFPGTETGKQMHTYFFIDGIYTDENGNITGDSIDLSPCDYKLDAVEEMDWETLFEEIVDVVEYYGEDTII